MFKKQESLSAEDKEAKALEEALEQIRAMEENAKMQVPQSNQLLEYLKRGDYVYELFAVLIHSGGALGGHYYAYIKSFEDGKWYCFNDSTVSEIQAGDVVGAIQSMYGGPGCGASAYMLQYRKYDPSLKKEDQMADESGPLGIEVGDELIPEY